MGLEKRGNREYYYQKKRVGGRVVSSYFAKGELAQELAGMVRQEKLFKEQVKAEEELKEKKFRETNELVNRVLIQTYKLIAATLLITNHHYHKGQWRKARVEQVKEEEGNKEMIVPICIDKEKELDGQFDMLLEKATGAKAESSEVKELRKFLRNNPAMWSQLSNLHDIALNNFLDKELVNPVAIELLRPKLKELKKELGWENVSILERLIIENIILAYVRWTVTEFKHTEVVSQNHSFDRGIYWEKRLNNAQRAYLRACESLARIKKLSKRSPELQSDFSQGLVM